MTNPRLTYAIQATPSPVEVSSNVMISMVVSNAKSPVTISSIEFRLPAQGPQASCLSSKQSNLGTSVPSDWTPVQVGSVFTLKPNNTASGTVVVGTEGLAFTFGPIEVNDAWGTAKIQVSEDDGSGLSDPLPFPISKWPTGFKFSNFKAADKSVQPGASTELTWLVHGAEELTLSYGGTTVKNPTSPYTTVGLNTSTVFTLEATATINNEPVFDTLVTSTEIKVPEVLDKYASYDIVYAGQGTALHWKTQQTDHCVLKANGVIIDPKAPSSTPSGGYPITANVMKPTTTFELAPVGDGSTGDSKNWPVFAKSLLLKQSFASQSGWGQVAVEQQGQTAYVCNSHTNALDFVDMTTGQVVASVPVGLGPRGVSLSVDGTQLYVSNAFDDTLSIVDVASHTVVGTIPVPSPAGSAVLGGTAFVANTTGSIMAVDLASKTVSSTIAVGGRPFDVTVTPDGRTLYVANNAGTTVDIYDVGTSQKTGSIDVNEAPTTVAGSGDGASVYAGTRMGTDIAVFNSHIDTPELTTSVPAYLNPAAIGVSGSGQFLAAVGPTGFFVFELGLPNAQVSAMAEVESPDIES